MISETASHPQEKSMLRLLTTVLKHDRVNVISETEPWGTLLATGAKRNETRTWPARLSYNGPLYRGPLAIHLTKQMNDAICYEEPFASALSKAGYAPGDKHPQGNTWGLPLGHIIALAWLEQVWQIEEETMHRIPDPSSTEYAFGSYRPKRFVWEFACVYRLSQPIPIERGKPSIWKWTPPDYFWNEIQAQANILCQRTSEKK